jgi:hypothetical protein
MNRMNRFSITGLALAFAAMFVFTRPAAAQTTYTWNVASGNWSTPGSWTPGTSVAGPTSIDTAVFGNNDTTASPTITNNTVDSGFAGTVANFNVNSSAVFSSLVYDVTYIPAGQTLTVTTNLQIGNVNEVSADNWTEAYIVGGGTLVMTGTNLLVQNYDDTTRNGTTAFFNLSGLANFIYNNTNGVIRVMDLLPGDSSDTGLGGNMLLAANSNSITASALHLGTSTSAQAGASGVFTLGAGTNIINASAINIGAEKSVMTVQANGGGLRIRGITGADSDNSDNITLGNRNVGGSTGTAQGSLLLNGCNVDIKANNLIIGENTGGPPSSKNDNGIGVLQFDTGTISANSLVMADNISANNVTPNPPNLAACFGTIQVGPNATLLINAGSVVDLASAAAAGPSSGLMIISNGLINCQGPLAMGPVNSTSTNSGVITFLNGGTLLMGPNSYIGAFTNPITALNMATGTDLSISIPSTAYTNICAQNVSWPSPDSGMTIAIAAMPAGVVVPSVFPLLYTTNFTGTFVNPILTLPPGFQGHLSQVGLAPTNTILLTITAAGQGGVDKLANPSFSLSPPGADWTGSSGASVLSTNATYPNTSACTHDTRNIDSLFGTNVAKLTGSFVAGGSTNTWSQNVPVAAGTAFAAGAFAYAAHEDMMSGADSFYYEVDFLNSTGGLLSAWESTIVSNLTCGETTPFQIDSWNSLSVTNAMQVTGGVNTGVVVSNVVATFLAPPGTVSSTFKAVFIQRNATDSGSMYISSADLGLLANPVPPSITSVAPNLITLCTNNYLTCVATSTITTISGFSVTVTTNTFLGNSTNTITYTVGSPGFTVTGLGTSSANIKLALAADTIYTVVITATDADNLVTSPTTVNFDTIAPTLVIEASDYNFTSNSISGLFFDTPANGGVALYTNLIGTQGIDENKLTRANPGTQGYYRTNDFTIINAANPAAPSGTEQKFITALANGDTLDTEQMIAFDSVGDWQNYSRSFGSNATNSAATGTYNVWCYLAVNGSGPQVAFYQVASSPAAPNQTTNILGTFGGSSFTDSGYANFVYAPLVDQFGNRLTVTVGSGEQTFQAQIANSDTPNVAFYMLTPVAPVLNPEFLNVYPNSNFEPTNTFTFSVGPAQGASISTNGIGVTINGITITSGLTFTAVAGGIWTVTYPILSNQLYSVTINVTNTMGLTASYSGSFTTFNLNNFHWMAVDYDFSTNNTTSTGGSVGDGWTGGLFINNPVPTGDSGAPSSDETYQFVTNSYFGYPTGLYPGIDPSGYGAMAQQSIDINWATNLTQDPQLTASNSIYRYSSGTIGDGVGSQVASDSFLLPEFLTARTVTLVGADNTTSSGPDTNICEFNIGYFSTNDWLNYTRIYPTGTFNVWGRIAGGSGVPFTNCMLSQVTSGVGTSNQMTQTLGYFSDSAPAGFQTYHWIEMLDTNGNIAVIQLNGLETLRLTAPTNATPSGNALNPLFFMLAPAVAPASAFSISASLSGSNVEIGIPTQSGHSYKLWSAPVVNGTWTQVGGTITGNGSIQYVSQPASSAQVYYRVTAQ